MSYEARAALVRSKNTVFQADSQRADLLDQSKTQTQLIALLLELVNKGHIIEFTAIKSDHHDDSGLGRHCHYYGFAADCWPLHSTEPGDYIDATDPKFAAFLADVRQSVWLHNIGLAGSADIACNQSAAGPTCFSDGGADHIHLAANG